MSSSNPARSALGLRTDAALGHLPLADSNWVRTLVQPTSTAPIGAGKVRYLEHEVGRSLLVHHRFEVDGQDLDVVVSIGRCGWGETRPPTPPGVRPGPIHTPAIDVDGVTISWFPFDPGLPDLRVDTSDWFATDDRPQRLAWVPQRRAVLRGSGRVLKLDAEPERIDAGVETLRALTAVVRVPEVVGVDPQRRWFLQERMPGRALERADARRCAEQAAAMVARFEHVEWAGPIVGPQLLLAQVAPVLELVSHAAPDLGPSIASINESLHRSAPPESDAGQLVTAHGDFNIGQLIGLEDGSLGLVDTDTLCLGLRGFDLASYAANVISGRRGDLRQANELMHALFTSGRSETHEIDPTHLRWMLAMVAARRLDRPIRRGKRKWRPRVEQLIEDVHALLR